MPRPKKAAVPVVDADVNKPQRTPEELRLALVECEKRLGDKRREKKDLVGALSQEIKDIQLDIDGIIQQLN